MAKIIASRSLRFRGEGDFSHQVTPGVAPQEFPDALVDTDHFRACVQSDWIRLVKDAPAAAELTEFDISSVSNEVLVAELAKRFDLPVDEVLDGLSRYEQEKAYRKSSGIDGDAGDWTEAGQDKDGFPVKKGSTEDVTTPKDTKGKGAAKTPPAK